MIKFSQRLGQGVMLRPEVSGRIAALGPATAAALRAAGRAVDVEALAGLRFELRGDGGLVGMSWTP